MTFPSPYPSAVTITKFRGDLKAFKDEALFPDDVINFWLTVATQMVDPNRWMDMTYLGIEMFTAHHVVLDVRNTMDVSVGSLPGLTRGAISAESVGPVSISYDTATTTEEDAGNWNLTVYGLRYIHFARQYGAGPVYFGGDMCPGPFNGPGWPGPWTAFLPSPNN
jgi:hypothetical protein